MWSNSNRISYLWLARFTDDDYLDICSVLANLVLRFDHVFTSVRSFSLQNEKLAIVVDIVDAYRIVRHDLLVLEEPGHGWWRFTNDIHVQSDGETDFHGYRLQIGPIDERFHCKINERKIQSFSNMPPRNRYITTHANEPWQCEDW